MPNTIQESFGKRVRDLRLAAGRSQEAFAAAANIDRASYGKLERGTINVSLVTMARIAAALGVDLPTLLVGVAFDADEILALPRLARGPRPIGGGD